jgi:hypothetical protein
MNNLLRGATRGAGLVAEAASKLKNDGFCVVPGPVPAEGLRALIDAYDRAMHEADPTDKRMGQTTLRVHDFVNRGPEFDSIYVYPPLLDACWQIIGRPLKLSTMLGRTLLPNRSAQELHVDYPPDSLGSTMVGFILMIDDFRKREWRDVLLKGIAHTITNLRSISQ